MVIDTKILKALLTAKHPEDVNMGLAVSRFYKGKDSQINRIINFYKILRTKSYKTQSYAGVIIEHNYDLSLNINHYLNLSYSNITIKDLPDNLTVNGDLDLQGNKGLKKLPKNLIVLGRLNLLDTKISLLPECLRIEGIYYMNTPLSYKIKTKEISEEHIKSRIIK